MAAAPTPKPYAFDKLKTKLLNNAQTSHYQVWITPTDDVLRWMQQKVDAIDFVDIKKLDELQEIISINCCEANLPGSTFFTHDVNVYNGVSEKFAYMRSYDDRADFTFYVNTQYTQLKFFELWMAYIAAESYAPNTRGGLNSDTYNYRMNFPKSYRQDMTITKFERSFAGIKNKGNIKTVGEEKPTKSLVYVFKQAYPISMNSIPVSYENSDLLKCTVSFSYTRYYIKTDNLNQIDIEPKQPTVPGQPATAANYGTDFGSLA